MSGGGDGMGQSILISLINKRDLEIYLDAG